MEKINENNFKNNSKIEINNTKYYEILGVDKDATFEQIKWAFRSSPFICLHPNKGHDPEKKKEFINAYEVLKDEKTRNIYDKYGEEGIKAYRSKKENFDFDLFDFSGSFNKNKDKFVKFNIALQDSYNGGYKELEYDRLILCPKCKDKSNIKCPKCCDEGKIIKIQKIGDLSLKFEEQCDECNGLGIKLENKNCEECGGNFMKVIKRKIKINLDKGVPDGHLYKFVGEGDEHYKKPADDLKVIIKIKHNENFIRKEADLFYKCKISLLEALTGVKSVINYLNGKQILIYSKPGEVIKPTTIKTIEGLGMPFFNFPNKYGNLYINFEIIFPDKISDKESKKLEEILKNINTSENIPDNIEKYLLKDYDGSNVNAFYEFGKNEDNENKDIEKVNCEHQ